MPFESEYFESGSASVHLMHYDSFDPEEYMAHLTLPEKERYRSFGHLSRQREFVATRVLRHSVFGFEHIHYNAVGAPYIKGMGFISISHAPGAVGIAFNREHQIGLDLEIIGEKALRLHTKFLNVPEIFALDTGDAAEMTRAWSAKETLYKLAGRKGIDFRRDLHLERTSGTEWKGKIINPGETLHTDLHIFEHRQYVVSYNSSPLVIEKN